MTTPDQSPVRSLSLVVIGAVLGGLAGFVYAAGAGITIEGHDHGPDHGQHHGQKHSQHDGEHAGQHGDHNHDEMVEIGSNDARIRLVVHQDTVSGVNLEVVTEGFTYAPDQAGADHRPGEGHGHLYIDGKKIARLYGPWYHLGGLEEGSHDVTVTLNANDHRLLSSGGTPLKDSVTVTIE